MGVSFFVSYFSYFAGLHPEIIALFLKISCFSKVFGFFRYSKVVKENRQKEESVVACSFCLFSYRGFGGCRPPCIFGCSSIL